MENQDFVRSIKLPKKVGTKPYSFITILYDEQIHMMQSKFNLALATQEKR